DVSRSNFLVGVSWFVPIPGSLPIAHGDRGREAVKSRRSRDKSSAATSDYASVANRLRAWLREHHPLDPTLSGEAERTEWSSAMAHLSSAQGGERAEDRRGHAAAWGLLLMLGRQIDDGHADFRQAANAARDTHALAEAVRLWRSSAPIHFLIE